MKRIILTVILLTVYIAIFYTTNIAYNIGSIGPAGGHIFYDKGHVSDGWRYLEAAPAEYEFVALFGSYKFDVKGTAVDIGAGKKNTEMILTSLEFLGQTGMAAQICTELVINGVSDWFIPSREELYLMYQNLFLHDIGGFCQVEDREIWKDWYYWSSTQYSHINFWIVGFEFGNKFFNWKYNPGRVRPVRAF